MLKNVVKMYCKKNPIKVAITTGAVVLCPLVLGTGLLLTTAAGVGCFFIGKKIEDKK